MTNDPSLAAVVSAFNALRFARAVDAEPVIIYHYCKALLRHVNRHPNKRLRSIAFRMINAARSDYNRSVAA